MRDLLIITTPRTGSDLLCQWLLKLFTFGWVGEWLAPGSLHRVEKELGLAAPWSLEEFVKKLRGQKSSKDNRIGIKVMWPAFAWTKIKDPSAEDGLFSHMKDPIIVYLTRKDKVAQAVSLYKARNLGVWQAEVNGKGKDIPFRHEGITNALMDIISQDTTWKIWLEARGYNFLEVQYEDFVESPKACIYKILDEGNISIGDFLEKVDRPRSKKLANANSMELIEQYYEARPDLVTLGDATRDSANAVTQAEPNNAQEKENSG